MHPPSAHNRLHSGTLLRDVQGLPARADLRAAVQLGSSPVVRQTGKVHRSKDLPGCSLQQLVNL